MSKIDLDKLMCSLGAYLTSNANVMFLLKKGFDKALSDQGFEYSNGDIREKDEVFQQQMAYNIDEWRKLHTNHYYRTDGLKPTQENFNIAVGESRKFAIGDWIADSFNTYKVTGVDERSYTLSDGVIELAYVCEDVEKIFHIWDIKQDVNDGDIVVDEQNNICLFRNLCGEDLDEFRSHAYYSLPCGKFVDGGGCHSFKNVRPADEHENKILFEKIKENGLYWNDKMKTLMQDTDGIGSIGLGKLCSILAPYLSKREISEIRQQLLDAYNDEINKS